MASPPRATQRPKTLVAHGHERIDPYFWLRDREDPAVLAYLQAENEFTDSALAPLADLRQSLFEEMKARILETDMSVPSRRGPWWYYGRTEEGKNYAIHCRRPAGAPEELPPAGEAGDAEEILLDENVLAEGHDYFAVGSASVSPDHRQLAYATDTEGNEQYQLHFRTLGGDDVAPEIVPNVSYGLAWSNDATVIFYVRFDEAQRPYQLWRHTLGGDPAADTLVLEEGDRRFSLGTARTRDDAFIMVSLHSTNTTEWLAIPADDPTAPPAVVMARREGVEYGLDHVGGSGGGWFVALTNDDALDFRVLCAADDHLGTASGWTEIVAERPGVRIEDVDAFARSSCSASAPTPRPRCASSPSMPPARSARPT